MKRTWAILLLLLMGIAPSGQAASPLDEPPSLVPTTLYFHMFDMLDDFVVTPNLPTAFPGIVPGVDYPAVPAEDASLRSMTGYFAQRPLPSDGQDSSRDFYIWFGPDRDVVIDPDSPMNVTLHVRIHPPGHAVERLAAAPLATLRLRVYESNGDDPANDTLEGSLTAYWADLAGMSPVLEGATAPDGHPVLVPDADGVITVRFDLAGKTTFERGAGLGFALDWWEGDASVPESARTWAAPFRFVSDAEHVNKLEFVTVDPGKIQYVHPEPAAGILLVHTATSWVWGAEGLTKEKLHLNIEGPTGAKSVEMVVSQNAHIAIPRNPDLEATYLWRFRQDGAADGIYRLTFTASDPTGQWRDVATASFVLSGDEAYGVDESGERVRSYAQESRDSPAPTIMAAALALALVAALHRRRT